MGKYRNDGPGARKSLGQNFLTDEAIIDKIIEGSNIGPSDHVIEIGPGKGALTGRLVERAGKVTAVELDERLTGLLEFSFGYADNLEVIHGDILKVDLAGLAGEGEHIKVIGNLPYYITTPIITRLLSSDLRWEEMTFMMQKEVAERIAEPPGGAKCGSITYFVQYYSDVTKICDVPRTAFRPMPKVESSVLKLARKTGGKYEGNESLLFECIKKGFGMRRKTLANSLNGTGGLEKAEITSVLEKAGIDAKRRAETLSMEEFKTIAKGIENEIIER